MGKDYIIESLALISNKSLLILLVAQEYIFASVCRESLKLCTKIGLGALRSIYISDLRPGKVILLVL